MRDLSAETRLPIHARTLSGRAGVYAATFAVYGALALIAVIVCGTLSVHPF